jgi:cytochrome P450
MGLRLKNHPLEFLADLHRNYGDFVYTRLGPFRSYWLFHPDLIYEALVAKAQSFRRRGRIIDVMRQWDGNGLVTNDGDGWKRQRRLVHPALHGRHLDAYAPVTVAVAQQLVRRWQETETERVEIYETMTSLTLEIIGQALFGADISAETQKLGDAVEALSQAVQIEAGTLFTWPDWMPLPSVQRKRRALRYLHEVIDRMIVKRRKSKRGRSDVLSILLRAVDLEGDGRGMSDQQAHDEAMTLFLAGHETTAGTMSWVWYLLARHPEVEAKVLNEVDQVLGGRAATDEDVPRLRYTECVVKETLRLYPQGYVLFPRVAGEEVSVGDYQITKGSYVFAAPYVVHRDPRWYADPEKFDPERFLQPRDTHHGCTFLGFGAGARVCVGSSLATMQIVLILATILQRFRVALAPGQGEVQPMPVFTLRPRGGIQMVLIDRSPVDKTGAGTGATNSP